MSFLHQLKWRFVNRAAQALAENQLRQRPPVVATIASTATLGPESIIENFTRRADQISIGAYSYIRGRILTYAHGGQVTIGEWCYVGVRTEIWSMDNITIGNRVLISHNVNINDGTAHSLDPQERHAHFREIIQKGHPTTKNALPGVRSAPIIIEDDVWISFGVTILKGVRVGAGSVVAAGSLVTHDIPPNTFYRCEVTPIMIPLSRLDPKGQ